MTFSAWTEQNEFSISICQDVLSETIVNEDENKCDNIDNDSNTIHTIECSVKHDNNEKEDTLRVGDEVIGERLEGATNVASGCKIVKFSREHECDDRHKSQQSQQP